MEISPLPFGYFNDQSITQIDGDLLDYLVLGTSSLTSTPSHGVLSRISVSKFSSKIEHSKLLTTWWLTAPKGQVLTKMGPYGSSS